MARSTHHPADGDSRRTACAASSSSCSPKVGAGRGGRIEEGLAEATAAGAGHSTRERDSHGPSDIVVVPTISQAARERAARILRRALIASILEEIERERRGVSDGSLTQDPGSAQIEGETRRSPTTAATVAEELTPTPPYRGER